MEVRIEWAGGWVGRGSRALFPAAAPSRIHAKRRGGGESGQGRGGASPEKADLRRPQNVPGSAGRCGVASGGSRPRPPARASLHLARAGPAPWSASGPAYAPGRPIRPQAWSRVGVGGVSGVGKRGCVVGGEAGAAKVGAMGYTTVDMKCTGAVQAQKSIMGAGGGHAVRDALRGADGAAAAYRTGERVRWPGTAGGLQGRPRRLVH